MRTLIAAATGLLLLTSVAQAKDMKACSADWKAMKAAKTASGPTHKQFMTTCLAAGSPGVAPAPATAPIAHSSMGSQPVAAAATAGAPVASSATPTGATAKCKDGSFSMSKHHSGSCSHHGGVAQFLQ